MARTANNKNRKTHGLILFWGILLFTSPTLAQESRFQKLGLHLDSWAEAQIQFWKKVYTEWDTDQILVHDSINLSQVYRIVDSEVEAHLARTEVREGLARISKTEGALVRREKLSPSDQKWFDVLQGIEDPRAYLFASDPARIRFQTGLKSRIENARQQARPYLKRMKEIFAEEGVPPEAVFLSFVESAFDWEARSKVGATGVWQFMPKTAAQNLRVSGSIDERYDPLKSTRAAARVLRGNYEALHSWGLAIMAYHQGVGLVKKAIRSTKSRDPLTLIRGFKNPSFKFASRNYLFEFLAMVDVEGSRPPAPEAEPSLPPFITVSFERGVRWKDLLQRYRLSEDRLRLLNPHFLKPILEGAQVIPAHYPIRLAGITLEEFRRLEYR